MKCGIKILLFLSAWLCAFIVTGCEKADEGKSETSPSFSGTYLKIGLIPEQNIFSQLERYEPFVDYISKKIEKKIELKILTRYGNIIDNFISMDLDAAFFGSFTYTLAKAKLGVEVIARPEDHSGISTYHGLIFVRKDSGIKSIKEMKGKVFAFVDKATTAGYIFPLAYFKRNGVNDCKLFFKETYFTGTHEDAISDVLNKRADIGAAKNTIFFRYSARNKKIKDELLILDKSLPVPENGIAVRKDLDDFVKLQLKQTLLNMDDDPEGAKILKRFGARAFIETFDHDYANVHTLVQEAGVNLRTYDYIND